MSNPKSKRQFYTEKLLELKQKFLSATSEEKTKLSKELDEILLEEIHSNVR